MNSYIQPLAGVEALKIGIDDVYSGLKSLKSRDKKIAKAAFDAI